MFIPNTIQPKAGDLLFWNFIKESNPPNHVSMLSTNFDKTTGKANVIINGGGNTLLPNSDGSVNIKAASFGTPDTYTNTGAGPASGTVVIASRDVSQFAEATIHISAVYQGKIILVEGIENA